MKKYVVERTIVINRDLEERLEEVISYYPGLSLNFIVNQALEEWLRGPQPIAKNRDSFIIDFAKGFGPLLLRENC